VVKIEKLKSCHLQQLNDFKVAPEQLQFVDTSQAILMSDTDECHAHVVVANNVVVGLFLIDTAYAKNYDFCSTNSIGLRSFFISTQHQGKGLAKQALLALTAYLQANYRQYAYIYLTVNCKNPVAYHCYLSVSFDDTGETYLGGAAGPQHIMRAKIS
jgi:RimJ/RimL family protein N-acetyltransferase